MKAKRPVIAVNERTGERKKFEDISKASAFLVTGHANVRQAVERNGLCCGWRIYDSAERIKARIEELQRQLSVLEDM